MEDYGARGEVEAPHSSKLAVESLPHHSGWPPLNLPYCERGSGCCLGINLRRAGQGPADPEDIDVAPRLIWAVDALHLRRLAAQALVELRCHVDHRVAAPDRKASVLAVTDE